MMKHQSAQLDNTEHIASVERKSLIAAMVKVIRGEPGTYIKDGIRYTMRPQKPSKLGIRRAIK